MSMHIDIVSSRKEVQHFSHDHPLIYDEMENPHACCSACGVMLLSSPSYRCSKNCNFFLHQPCIQLPKSSRSYDFRRDSYEVELFAKPPYDNCNCERCGNLCKNFTYKCSMSFWGGAFFLHCQCAFPLEINIKHISHHEHSLMAMWKDASLECDACGRDQKGIIFFCPKCIFSIHQECCLLPSIAKNNQHRHLLSLKYSLQNFDLALRNNCLICCHKVSLWFGGYVCGMCHLGAHLNCVASTLEGTEIIQASVHLPTMPDTSPSLIARILLQNNKVESEIEDVKSKIGKYHTDHSSWIFHNRESDGQLVCNACIQPIISPPSHHGCPQPHCDFLLHQFCANLPPVIKDYIWDEKINMYSESSDSFCSMFRCRRCQKKPNGFSYGCGEYSIDVECAIAPISIKHESHSQHPLALSTWYSAIQEVLFAAVIIIPWETYTIVDFVIQD